MTQGTLPSPAPSEADLARAVQALLAGQLAAFPTETVYGLGADAEQHEAVARIYAAKERPANHPVIVHVAPGADLGYWVTDVPALAHALIDTFWPGPLTLILRRADRIPDAVSGGQTSIGLRCPAHPVAQALLTAFAAAKPSGQGGVAAPSANRFGHVSPTRAAHVQAEFPELVAAGMPLLDGGDAEVGIESTILDLSGLCEGRPPTLLRPGHITAEQLAQVLGRAPAAPDASATRASGTLKAHYAPRTPLELADPMRLGALITGEGVDAGVRWVILSYATAPAGLDPRLHWHTLPADPDAYAHDLYAALRELDCAGYGRIVVQRPPSDASWQAVNDRIGRAGAAFDLSSDPT